MEKIFEPIIDPISLPTIPLHIYPIVSFMLWSLNYGENSVIVAPSHISLRRQLRDGGLIFCSLPHQFRTEQSILMPPVTDHEERHRCARPSLPMLFCKKAFLSCPVLSFHLNPTLMSPQAQRARAVVWHWRRNSDAHQKKKKSFLDILAYKQQGV